MNDTSFPNGVRHIAAVADIPVVDDNEDVHSDCSDDTTYSTWRAPPQDLRGNKYQNEMKVQDELLRRNLFCAMATDSPSTNFGIVGTHAAFHRNVIEN